MKTLETLRQQLSRGEFEFNRHAFRRAVERNSNDMEIRQAGANAKIIEDYPDDKYGPSCLVFGLTLARRPLHIQCSYPSRPLVKIITLYEPDPRRWVDFKVRRPADEQ